MSLSDSLACSTRSKFFLYLCLSLSIACWFYSFQGSYLACPPGSKFFLSDCLSGSLLVLFSSLLVELLSVSLAPSPVLLAPRRLSASFSCLFVFISVSLLYVSLNLPCLFYSLQRNYLCFSCLSFLHYKRLYYVLLIIQPTVCSTLYGGTTPDYHMCFILSGDTTTHSMVSRVPGSWCHRRGFLLMTDFGTFS